MSPARCWTPGPNFLRIDVHNGATRAVQLPGQYASVYDLAWAAGRLFFLSLGYPPGAGSTSHVGSFSPSGDQLARSSGEEVGSWLVPLGSALFSAGPSATCAEASLSVWRVDEQNLRTSVVANLRPSGDPCTGDGFRAVAAAGNSLVVLSGSALYRVALAAR